MAVADSGSAEIEILLIVLGISGAGAVFYFWYRTLKDNEIVLVNGFGKYYFGWHAEGEGTYSATKWVVLMYLPILPLERQGFKPLDDPSQRMNPGLIEVAGALLGAGPEENYPLVIFARERPRGKEVLRTYLNTYLLLPLALAWPVVLFLLAAPLIKNLPGPTRQSPWFAGTLFGFVLAYFVYFIYCIIKAIRKTYCFREYENSSRE